MEKDKVSYVVKDIEKEIWKKFRGISLLKGYNSAGECIVSLINKYVSNNAK
tara:strand:+ start:490 stop:642 length:153 start_codon:yes stop_codon:yes gene_type:complete